MRTADNIRSSTLRAIDNSLRARPGSRRCCGLSPVSPANKQQARFASGVFRSVTALGAVRILLTVVSLAIWPAVSQAADAPVPAPAKLERITAFFNHEVATGKLPGAVILVQQHGRPIYLKCFGVRDVATKLPMTADTIFAIHSMTKPITSVAAMMLIEAGKLALEDPVSKFVPSFADVKVGIETTAADGSPTLEFVAPKRAITVMDLLRHTSEISYEYIGGKWVEKAYSEARIFDGRFDNDLFAKRIAKLPLARQPGTLWRYGHSTDVLGRIIEIV